MGSCCTKPDVRQAAYAAPPAAVSSPGMESRRATTTDQSPVPHPPSRHASMRGQPSQSQNPLPSTNEASGDHWRVVMQEGTPPAPASDHTLLSVGGNLLSLSGDGMHAFGTADFKWSRVVTKGNPPANRTGHSCVQYNHQLYILGSDTLSCQSLYCFDAKASAWTVVKDDGDRPPQLAGHSAVVIGNTMVVFGGSALHAPHTNDMYIFDFATGLWTFVPPDAPVEANGTARQRPSLMPAPRADHSACIVRQRMLVFGGDPVQDKTQAFVQYSAVSKRWSAVPSVGEAPTPRSRHSTATWHHLMFVFGGQSVGPDQKLLGDSFIFNCATAVWCSLDADNCSPHRFGLYAGAACAVEGNHVYLQGGEGPNGTTYDEMYQLDISRLGFSTIAFASPAVASSHRQWEDVTRSASATRGSPLAPSRDH